MKSSTDDPVEIPPRKDFKRVGLLVFSVKRDILEALNP
jgi:hypothetical protein